MPWELVCVNNLENILEPNSVDQLVLEYNQKFLAELFCRLIFRGYSHVVIWRKVVCLKFGFDEPLIDLGPLAFMTVRQEF